MFLRATLGIGLMSLLLLAADASAAKPGKRKARTESALVTVTYSVADLVVPIDMNVSEKNADAGQTREDQLMDLIRTAVAPESWTEKGGRATMQYFSIGLGLVVQQTAEQHAKINALLTQLRRLQDLEVAVELRVFSVSPSTFERLEFNKGKSSDLDESARKPGDDCRRLSDLQVYQLLEAAQGDQQTNVMQAPKMTIFNGQKAMINVTEQQVFVTSMKREQGKLVPGMENISTGHRFHVRPTVSPDRKQVTVSFGAYLANLDGPVSLIPVNLIDDDQRATINFIQQPRVRKLEVERTIKLDDQQTGLVYLGQTMTEARAESSTAPPILSRIPYVNRLFRTVGYSREPAYVFLLVTPRIIVNEQETRK